MGLSRWEFVRMKIVVHGRGFAREAIRSQVHDFDCICRRVECAVAPSCLSIGGHAARAEAARGDVERHEPGFRRSAWAVLHLGVARRLAEGIRPSSAQLGSLFDFMHAAFASKLIVSRVHLYIVLRETPGRVDFEEGAVATIKDVHLGIRQFWVLRCVVSAISLADVLSHERSTLLRELAMKDQKSISRWSWLEQLSSQLLFVIVILGTLNVTTVVFVLEATVHKTRLIVEMSVVAIENADQGVLVDAR